MVMSPVFVGFSDPVVPGGQSFTTAGTHSFTVPVFNTITFTLYGGGGSSSTVYAHGVTGGATTIAALGLTANGGAGGRYDSDPSEASNAGTAAGGTASGGDTNTTGNPGAAGNGITNTGAGGHGLYANNGGGVASPCSGTFQPGQSATNFGAGAGGSYAYNDVGPTYATCGGAGGGGRCIKTYVNGGPLSAGTVLSLTVGAGATNSGYGSGYRGRIDISWS